MNMMAKAKSAMAEKAAAAKEKLENLDIKAEKEKLYANEYVQKAYDFKQSAKHATPRRWISEQMGYPMEKHVYYTEDGYINTLFRIPGPKGFPEAAGGQGKPVVLY